MASSWVAMPQKTPFARLRIAIGDHALHQVDVVGVDVGLRGKSDFGAFLVGSLAEADANSLPQETVGVGVGAEEVGLQDGADAAGKFC